MKITNYITNLRNGPRGQAVIFVLILLASGLIISVAVFNIVGQHTLLTGIETDQERAVQLAEAGVNRASFELNHNANWNGLNETALGEGSYEVSVTTISSNEKEIRSTGYYPNKANPKAKRLVKVRFTTGTVNPSFNYGAQVGEGGLEFESNASVNGSVYSDGNIIGAPGALISGGILLALRAHQSAVMHGLLAERLQSRISSGLFIMPITNLGNK